MKPKHASDSTEQQTAEKKVLSLLNKKYNLKLANKKIVLQSTTFQLDGYSENPPVLCEIYSRIGKLKPAQKNKINKDILKMLLIEKMSEMPDPAYPVGRQVRHDNVGKFRKIIAFADEEAAGSFEGGSVLVFKAQRLF